MIYRALCDERITFWWRPFLASFQQGASDGVRPDPLSSVSPWELVQKTHGRDTWGLCLPLLRILAIGKWGGRFVQILAKHKNAFNSSSMSPRYHAWVKDRIAFYKRVEPTAPPRDHTTRLRFACSHQ